MSAGIKTIAIATDGSENVMNAVEWGIELAKANGAKVSALYVVPHTGVTLAMRGEMWSKALESHLKDEGEKATAYVVEAGDCSHD